MYNWTASPQILARCFIDPAAITDNLAKLYLEVRILASKEEE